MVPFPNLIRKARSTVGLMRTVENWGVAFLDHAKLFTGSYRCKLKSGLDFQLRAGTDDSRVLFEIYVQNCYGAAIVTPGATVVDIGANIGCFSVLAAQKASRVIACEPHPDNLEILRKNCAMNRAANVEIIPCAISSASGKSALFLPKDDKFFGRYSLQNDRGMPSIEVSCLTVEDLFRQAHLVSVDLMKIDCEGSEYEILQGLPASTFSQIQQMIIECHPIPDHPEWSQSNLGSFLQDRGFEVVDRATLLYARRPESSCPQRNDASN